MSMEKIVRPFQSPVVFGRANVSRSGETDASEEPIITLQFGKKGASVKTLSGNYNSTITFYMDQKSKEVDRKVTTKRITNPEDSSQYVDVEVINKLTDKTGSGPDYQKTERTFKNKTEEGA